MAEPLVLYFRDGCHLCEELAAVLYREWPHLAAGMEWRDVDADPNWRTRFGTQIPVLFRGDREISRLRPDPQRLRELLGEPDSSQ